MPGLTLVIGTRNYSSWSLRPWVLLRHLGLAFEERLFHFDTPEFSREVGRLSPTRRVPVLLHGEQRIWESLAICEYASELADGRGWPRQAAARAEARSLASEMHAGFNNLRAECPMNVRARGRQVPMTPGLARDVARIDAMWADCRSRFGQDGPWLFGQYTAADAMYAPVALRFRTYQLPLSGPSLAYRDTVLGDQHLLEWERQSLHEGVTLAHEEVGVTP